MSSIEDRIVRDVTQDDIDLFLMDMKFRYRVARTRFGPGASLHESMKVIEEEIEEVNKLVYERIDGPLDYKIRLVKIRQELLDVASMCMGMALENAPKAIPWFPAEFK